MYLDLYGYWKAPKEVNYIIRDSRFMRLFDIFQGGPVRYISYNSHRNRGDHSLGVGYLIYLLGGDTEEIIAGVIHDIGHFPMAHAIDNELSKKGHNTHERLDILEKILDGWKVGYHDLFEIAKNIKNGKYKILENEIPKVCADRLEYTLRDGFYHRYVSKEDLTNIIADIKFNGNEITFSKENAIKIFELYYKLNIGHYMDDKEAVLHAIYGKIINSMIKKGELTIDELLTMTDTELNQYLLKFYPDLNKIDKIILIPGDKYKVYPKYRIIDPITHDGNHVSEFYDKFEERKEILKEKSKPRSFDIII